MTIKFSEMTPTSALASADYIVLVQDVGGVPSNAIISRDALIAALRASQPSVPLSIVTGTATADCSQSNTFTLTLTENAILAVSNVPGAGFTAEIEVQISQDGVGGYTLALPPSFTPIGGSDTTVSTTANSVTILSAKTFDGGTTWRYVMQESV